MKLLVFVLVLLAFFEAAPVKCAPMEHNTSGLTVDSVKRRLDIVLEMAKVRTPISKINSIKYKDVSGFTYTVEYEGGSGDKCQIVWTDVPYDAIHPQEINNSCQSRASPVTTIFYGPKSSQKVDSSPASNKIVEM